MLPARLTLSRLVLRPWAPSDVAEVSRALSDPDIARWSPPGDPITLAAAEHWVLRRSDATDTTRACWAVTDRSTGGLVGSVALNRIDAAAEGASIGYWTLPEARGHGVAAAAVRAATEWAFSSLALHRIELCHAVENEASCRVAVKASYPCEGTLRDSMRYSDGKWHDEHLHARLATDPP
jgi:RimJ/RimL family protein N-acetyltransferase